MQRSRSIVLLVLAAVAAAACGASTTAATATSAATATTAPGSSSPSSPVTATAASTDPASAAPTEAGVSTPTPAPTAATPGNGFALAATVWFSGYLITLTGGTYDPATHVLHVDGTFENTSTQQTELVQLGSSVTVVSTAHVLPAYVTAGIVPVGATVKGQIQVQAPADFTVADAVLTFGGSTQHQATVPLGGGTASSDQPAAISIAGKVTIGKYVSYTVASAMLVPAACSGYPDRIRFGPLDAGQVSILLWGTAANRDPLNYAHIDQGYVVLGDGSRVASNPPMSLSLPNGATLPHQGMCFAVPEPASGTYTLKLHEYRSKATGSLTFVIP